LFDPQTDDGKLPPQTRKRKEHQANSLGGSTVPACGRRARC